MRMCAARHCRTWRPLPGPWNEFAAMEWQACFPAPKKIFRSSFTPRVLLGLPGAERETFSGRDYIRFMNSSLGR